jgi:acyl-CoA thioesterase
MQGFRDVMAAPVRPVDGTRAVLETELGGDWLQGKSAFGGLQAALALRAMRAVVDEALPLRALQVTFVAPVLAGPVRVDAERVRQGRAITHAQCRIGSAGQTSALVVGLFGAARPSKATLALPPPGEVKRRDALKETPFRPDAMVPFLQHYRTFWAEGQRPFTASPPRRLAVWAQLRDPPPDPGDATAAANFNEANAVAIADLPPTPALSLLEAPAPGTSLTWLLEFLVDPRELDPADWLLVTCEARAAGDGYVTQTALLWDDDGRGVAVSHQTVAVFG